MRGRRSTLAPSYSCGLLNALLLHLKFERDGAQQLHLPNAALINEALHVYLFWVRAPGEGFWVFLGVRPEIALPQDLKYGNE